MIRRQPFTKISIAILFGAIGLIGFIIHNSVAIVTTKFGLNLFLSNCLGFLLANIFTVQAHSRYTFKTTPNIKNKLYYFFASVALLFVSNGMLFTLRSITSLSILSMLLVSNFTVACISFHVTRFILKR